MIGFSPSPRIDAAIDAALSRIRVRAAGLGADFATLADAVTRAASGGKRFRPALVTAAFEAFAPDREGGQGLYDVAAAFELLHAAFVVHDDVIDHDLVRRGIPNVGGEFRTIGAARGADASGAALLGDAAAILAGDLLLHEAFRLVGLADIGSVARSRVYALLDDAVLVSAAGELDDVAHSVSADVTATADAISTAFNKTAVYSFQSPLVAGAALAGADDDALASLGAAAGPLGLAYQLVDDLIGAFGSESQAGRESGADLREAKRTPLVALAREGADWTDVSAALALAPTGPIAVREAQRTLEESGARERLRALVDETLTQARFAADDPALPPAAGALLREIAAKIESRVP